jgi:glutamate dehydrogenase/leucine dehydrogenase
MIPAALENQIGEHEAKLLDVKVIAEGANGPTSPRERSCSSSAASTSSPTCWPTPAA